MVFRKLPYFVVQITYLDSLCKSSLVKGATAFIHLFILFVEWPHGGGVEVHATGCCWLNILLHAIGVWRWVAVGCSLDEWLSLNLCGCFIVVDKWMFPWFTNHVNIVFLCWVAQEIKDCTYFRWKLFQVYQVTVEDFEAGWNSVFFFLLQQKMCFYLWTTKYFNIAI